MKRTRLRAGVVAATLAAGALSAVPAYAVTGGTPAVAGTGDFVVRLHVGEVQRCTGALIGAQWVLTATSCFAPAGQPVPAGAPPQPTTAFIGGTTVAVTRIVAHPDRGITLAKLPERLTGVTTVAVSGSAAAAGEQLTVAGYGRTATEWAPAGLQQATATVRAATATTLDLTGAGLCQGDAGAPAWRTVNGVPQIVGLGIGATRQNCLGASSAEEGSTAARLDDVAGWIATNAPAAPLPSFEITHASWNGVGSFDLGSIRDLVVPFDYEHSGRQDHVLTYRPGSSYVAIAKHNADNTFTTVFTSTSGIGGFDLATSSDRIVPFDYEHTGKLDHLFIYRPGNRVAFVVKHTAGNTFTYVWASGAGIAGYDLADVRDQVVAFDYEHTGKVDHLLIYRPGNRNASVVKHNADNSFSLVWTGVGGIGGFDLATNRDRIVPFDYEHTGKLDHLLIYRPGDRIAYVAKHNADNTFTTAWSSFSGIAGFDLSNLADQVTPYDYDAAGRADHLVLYRPGARLVVIAKHVPGANPFSAVYTGTGGIAGIDLAVGADRIVAYDSEHRGTADSLLITRAGNKLFYVVRRQSAEPANPPAGTAPSAGPSIVDDGAYPDAAAIEAAQHIKLISGDGHIMLADCATPPVNHVSVLKVHTADEIGPDGAGLVCFKVTATTGLLNLQVPAVYEIRGDGQQSGSGHQVSAKVTTDAGVVTTVAVNPSGSTQVGIGASPDNDPTTLLQLKVIG